MVWKVVNIGDTGTGSKFGADDTDKINKLFSGIDVDDIDINADWTFRSGKLNIRNPANTFSYNIVAGAITTSNRTLNLPVLTSSDTMAVTGLAQTFSNKTLDSSCIISSSSSLPANAVKTDATNVMGDFDTSFMDNRVRIYNPANTFRYTIIGAAIGADRNLTLPLITGPDTLASLGLAQTFTASQTFNTILVGTNARVSLLDTDLSAVRSIKFPNTNASLSGIVQRSGGVDDINLTNTEQDMLNYTVLGNSMRANGAVRFTITGYILQNNVTGTTYTFAVKFGGTNMWADVSPTIAQSATKIPFRIIGEVFNKNATNAQGLSGYIIVNDTTAATTGIGDISSDTNTSPPAFSGNFDSEGADTTKDTTVDQTLQVTVTMSVSSSTVHTVVKQVMVELFTYT